MFKRVQVGAGTLTNARHNDSTPDSALNCHRGSPADSSGNPVGAIIVGGDEAKKCKVPNRDIPTGSDSSQKCKALMNIEFEPAIHFNPHEPNGSLTRNLTVG